MRENRPAMQGSFPDFMHFSTVSISYRWDIFLYILGICGQIPDYRA
jgi:hypothetical protein